MTGITAVNSLMPFEFEGAARASETAVIEVAWIEAPGFPDYEVSEFGGIRRKTDSRKSKAGDVLKGSADALGYVRFKLSLNGKKFVVAAHRLTCAAFNGPMPFDGAVCRHLDDNPSNNHYKNLAWGTHLDNHNDRRRNGHSFSGAKNGRAKLTDQRIKEIRSRFDGKFGSVSRLSREYGIANSQMWEICHGKSWQEVAR